MSVFLSCLLTVTAGFSSVESNGPVVQGVDPAHGVVVEAVLLERTQAHLRFQVRVRNASDKAVLIVSDPVRVEGSKGPYLSLNESNPGLLELRFELFPLPVHTIYAPKHRVTLLPLAPGATHLEDVMLKIPFRNTRPPWDESLRTSAIDIAKIHEVVAKVGIFPDDAAIRVMLSNIDAFHGLESPSSGPLKGKVLFEIQTVVSSKPLKL